MGSGRFFRERATSRHVTGIEPRPSKPRVIAKRAYELFLQRGGEHGRDWEDWLTAERELLPPGVGRDRRPCSSVTILENLKPEI